jgi:hypothetical protein
MRPSPGLSYRELFCLIARSAGEEESGGGKAKREADRGSRIPPRVETESKLLTMYRTLRLVGVPYTLPPETPKDRVVILQDAMRKAFKDAESHREYKKLTGEDPDPLMPEEMEKAIREMPRPAEVIELLEVSEEGRLPAR